MLWRHSRGNSWRRHGLHGPVWIVESTARIHSFHRTRVLGFRSLSWIDRLPYPRRFPMRSFACWRPNHGPLRNNQISPHRRRIRAIVVFSQNRWGPSSSSASANLVCVFCAETRTDEFSCDLHIETGSLYMFFTYRNGSYSETLYTSSSKSWPAKSHLRQGAKRANQKTRILNRNSLRPRCCK